MSAALLRRYVAHTVADHGRSAHLIREARSFVEAALLYTEHWHPAQARTARSRSR
jgi:hypothetical protein